MKGKNRILAATAVAALACGCGLLDDDPRRGNSKEPKTITDSTAVAMMTSVRYPDGYDWKKDIEYGEVECTLVFETEDSTFLELPVGSEYLRASDTDMHRIVNSDLYEDYSTDKETILYKNGEELYRFDDREMVTCVYPYGDDLYTLGTSRGKGGYALRKNGALTSWSNNIVPVCDLYHDQGKLCFSGIASTMILGKKTDQWYAIENGGAMPVSPQTSGDVITSLREINGHMYATIQYQMLSYLQIDAEQFSLNSNLRADVTISEMMYDGKSVWVDGQMTFDGGTMYMLWKDGYSYYHTDISFRKVASRIVGDSIWTLGYNETSKRWGIWHDEEFTWIDEGFHPHPSYAMAVVDGSVYVALLDSNEKPALWKDGSIRVFEFNGYIDRLEKGYLTKSRISIGRG